MAGGNCQALQAALIATHDYKAGRVRRQLLEGLGCCVIGSEHRYFGPFFILSCFLFSRPFYLFSYLISLLGCLPSFCPFVLRISFFSSFVSSFISCIHSSILPSSISFFLPFNYSSSHYFFASTFLTPCLFPSFLLSPLPSLIYPLIRSLFLFPFLLSSLFLFLLSFMFFFFPSFPFTVSSVQEVEILFVYPLKMQRNREKAAPRNTWYIGCVLGDLIKRTKQRQVFVLTRISAFTLCVMYLRVLKERFAVRVV